MFCRKEKLARDVTTTQAPAEVCKACGCFVSPTYAKRVVVTNTRWGYDSVEFFCKQDARRLVADGEAWDFLAAAPVGLASWKSTAPCAAMKVINEPAAACTTSSS